ncbi:hypothetical protein EV363DRAFT_1401366 [Boletus edulis]|nr:hypothetical protein EV363DRAFT_1401366 [Boletus edulis]
MLSPFALIVPRPNIPPTVPPTFAPRTPNRSPVASHILLSPPSANRNTQITDFEDPNAVWKEDQIRLLSRTLDALPAHLVTPFNGSVPPSNLLDKIARGISAAKGPNDWPHSIRATRVKLLEVARREAREERRKAITEERCVPLGSLAWQEVLQPRTNTPIHTRRPIYRQSSMDFMDSDKSDRSESIARLSNRLQRHDHVLHHPYLRPAHTRHRPELNKRSPSTPISSTLNSNRHSGVRKSTISATSASSSSFGSPMSISVPLRPSSLRRTSTLTLASASEVHADADAENASKNADFRRSGGYPEANMDTKVVARVRRVPSYDGGGDVTSPAPATPAASIPKKPKLTPVNAMKPTPRTPPNEPRMLVPEKITPTHVSTHTKKVRKGHKPQLSVSSDEEEKIRSKTAKKVRTREPSWSVPLAPAAQVQTSLLLSSALPRDKGGYDSGRSSSTGIKSKASMSSSSSTDNDLSTASTETAATTVSNLSTSDAKHKSPRNPNFFIQVPPLQSPVEAKKPARRNPTRNPSMFGHELPHPQRTPASPSRIPVSSPMPLSPPMSLAATLTSTFSTSPPSTSSRPRTLRRAARRISFGSVAVNGSSLNPVENSRRHDGETPALGSAFQFA